MAAADPAVNEAPFYLRTGVQKAAWRTVHQWIPVDSSMYPAAFDRWFEREATRRARTKKRRRRFTRSITECFPRYRDAALGYLHRRMLHAPVAQFSEALCQYLFELALQLVILREEREVPIEDAEAIFSRAIPMSWRAQAKDYLANHPDQPDAPEARLASAAEIINWWGFHCQSNPIFAVGEFGITDILGLRVKFGNVIDVRALDHLRILRMTMQRFDMAWKVDVTEADGSGEHAQVCPLSFVGPFYLTVLVEGRPANLFPEGSDIWDGTTVAGRQVTLRMDNPFNRGIIFAFDPHLLDSDPVAAAMDSVEDNDEEDNNNN